MRQSPLATIGLVVLLLASACTPEQAFAPRLTSTLAATPTAEPATGPRAPSPESATLAAEQALAVVQQAYAVLYQQYVDPLDSRALLGAAWDGFIRAVGSARAGADAAPPPFTGDPNADWALFRRHYLAVAGRHEQANQPELAYAALRQMAENVGDCHTGFLTARQREEQDARLAGQAEFGGVGIRIRRRPNDPNAPLVVWELISGGSAGKAGIKPGDAITKVDGREVVGEATEQIAQLIRGPVGTSVKLTVERPGERRARDFNLKRVRIQEPILHKEVLEGKIGYLRLYGFPAGLEAQVVESLREFDRQQVRGWILDLRLNGGGTLNTLERILSKFLRQGPFAYQVDRAGNRQVLGPDGSYWPVHKPLVVLVSESTSSAAEIFAAAIQEYGAGAVVGTRTAGCLGIGGRFRLADGSGLNVTMSKLLGPTGQDLNRVGVQPNQFVELTAADLAAGRDPQLQLAIARLKAA